MHHRGSGPLSKPWLVGRIPKRSRRSVSNGEELLLCGVSTTACAEENQNGNHAPSGFLGCWTGATTFNSGRASERWKFVDGRSVRQSR